MPENLDASTEAAIGNLEVQFSAMFNRVRASMRDRALRVHPDLQPMGYKVLGTLVRSGKTHAVVLAEQLMTDKSIISRTIRQLEELSLVSREADPNDGRASFIVATPFAVERIESVRRDDQEMLYSRMGEWDVEDIERLAELLKKLTEIV